MERTLNAEEVLSEARRKARTVLRIALKLRSELGERRPCGRRSLEDAVRLGLLASELAPRYLEVVEWGRSRVLMLRSS